MAEMEITAAYASVVEDEGMLFVGFAEGEDADEPYVLFRQPVGGGRVWFEVSDESFGAEDAVEALEFHADRIEITIAAGEVATFGYLARVVVLVGPECDSGPEAIAALRQMMA
jgi:hypothetical protein